MFIPENALKLLGLQEYCQNTHVTQCNYVKNICFQLIYMET